MLSTLCVVMEQCHRHQGKTSATTSGVTQERQTTLVTNTAALTFEPRTGAWCDSGRSDTTGINYQDGADHSECKHPRYTHLPTGTRQLNTSWRWEEGCGPARRCRSCRLPLQGRSALYITLCCLDLSESGAKLALRILLETLGHI